LIFSYQDDAYKIMIKAYSSFASDAQLVGMSLAYKSLLPWSL